MPRLALLTCLVVAVSACAGDDATDQPAPSMLVGVIVDVASESGEVRSFTLESEAGTFEIFIADDVDYGFDLGHLNEHRATGDPVRCTLEERDGRLVALSILDA